MLRFKGTCQFIELTDGGLLFDGPKRLVWNEVSPQDHALINKIKSQQEIDQQDIESPLGQKLRKNSFFAEYSKEFDSDSRYARQIEYLGGHTDKPEALQASIQKKKVLILGCGGTGSMITQALLGHGFCDFVFVDKDTVQESNFNRQLFFKNSQLGTLKVEALKESVLGTNPSAKVRTSHLHVSDTQSIAKLLKTHKPDILVNGADLPPILIQKWATEASLESSIPVLMGGVGSHEGSVGPLLSTTSSKTHFLDWLDRKLKLVKTDSLRPVRGSLAATNLLCSSLMALEVFRYFTNQNSCQCLDTKLIFDFANYSVSKRISFNDSP